MKKIISISILVFTFLQFGNSQSTPLIEKYIRSVKQSSVDTFTIMDEKFYEYDANENLISKIHKSYFDDGSLRDWKGIFFEYHPNKKIAKETTKRYNPTVNLWINEKWIDYKYDLNNCKIEEIHTENSGGDSLILSYVQNNNCQWSVKLATGTSPLDPSLFIPYFRCERFYDNDNKSYEEKFFLYFTFIDTSFQQNTNYYTYDESENLIEQKTIYNRDNPFSSGYLDRKLHIEYDQFENPIEVNYFEKASDTLPWELVKTQYLFNDYDEKDFLVQKRLDSYKSPPPHLTPDNSYFYKYEYTCDGLQELVQTENFEDGSITLQQYIYKGKNECFDLDEKNLSLEVSPNPSSGIFNITSPIFESGDTEIIVFTIDGKKILQKNENSRSTTSSIDLTSFENGFYILQLRNGKHYLTSKIIFTR